MSISSAASIMTAPYSLSDFHPLRPPRSGLRLVMPNDNPTTLSPDSLESPSCDHTLRSLAHASTDVLLATSEGSDESFEGSTESPSPQTPATPQALQVGKLPSAATVRAPSAEGVARPSPAHVRARRKPVPSVVDLLGYSDDPLPAHPLTRRTTGALGTPGNGSLSGPQRFTVGPLAGMEFPDLDHEADHESSRHSRKHSAGSGFTLQNGNASALSLPMRVLEVDRPTSIVGGPRTNAMRRSTYDCSSTYTCNYNSSKPDLSLSKRSAASNDDELVFPPPRRQSLYRGRSGKSITAASELAELRRITHSASMDFDSIKRQNRANQTSLLIGDNDSDQSSVHENREGPVTKRLKSLKRTATTNYTKTSLQLMKTSTIEEKPREPTQGWMEWVCSVVPCLHREKAPLHSPSSSTSTTPEKKPEVRVSTSSSI